MHLPVRVWKHCRVKSLVSIFSIPPDFTGAIWAAIACNPWKVDPSRNQSFVLRFGAAVSKLRLNTRPPTNVQEMNVQISIHEVHACPS